MNGTTKEFRQIIKEICLKLEKGYGELNHDTLREGVKKINRYLKKIDRIEGKKIDKIEIIPAWKFYLWKIFCPRRADQEITLWFRKVQTSTKQICTKKD